MAVVIRLIAVCVGLSVLGCASMPPRAVWTRKFGGVVRDHREQRLARLARQFADHVPFDCTYRVLDCSNPCAYAWPDRWIYLSRGLIDLLDDHQLTAVIAHEIGHLLDDGHVTPPAGLRGERANGVDPEAQADAIALTLLDRLGIPRAAVASMLEMVAASDGISADARTAMTRRAQSIRAQVHATSKASGRSPRPSPTADPGSAAAREPEL